MWIEFFGPPGVGKSTTYAALCAHNPAALNKRNISGAPIPDEWRTFYHHVIDAYTRADPGLTPPRRRTFERKIRIASGAHMSARMALLDDMLCQRGQSLAAAGGQWEDIETFYELVPAPALVVCLRAPAETIRTRAKARKKRTDLSGECDRALQVMDIAIPIMRERGFNILELSSMDPPEENAHAIGNHIRDTVK